MVFGVEFVEQAVKCGMAVDQSSFYLYDFPLPYAFPSYESQSWQQLAL